MPCQRRAHGHLSINDPGEQVHGTNFTRLWPVESAPRHVTAMPGGNCKKYRWGGRAWWMLFTALKILTDRTFHPVSSDRKTKKRWHTENRRIMSEQHNRLTAWCQNYDKTIYKEPGPSIQSRSDCPKCYSQQKLVSWEQKIPESMFSLDTWKICNKDSKIILSLKKTVIKSPVNMESLTHEEITQYL